MSMIERIFLDLKMKKLMSDQEEAIQTRERLFDSDNDHTIDGNDKKKIIDDRKEYEISDECHGSDALSSGVAKKINEGATNNSNEPIIDIVQPADLKPKHLGFTRTLLLAMFAAMIGTGAQFGYALGVMNPPSEVSESLR